MKILLFIWFLIPIVCFGQNRVPSPPLIITAGTGSPALTLVSPTYTQPIIYCYDGTNNLFRIEANGQLTLSVTTNQVVWGSTNTAPANTNYAVKWISVQVSGDTNAYRMPLYK